MKAVVRPGFVGQEHPRLGTLLGGVTYEVEALGALFEEAPPEAAKKPAKRAGKEQDNG